MFGMNVLRKARLAVAPTAAAFLVSAGVAAAGLAIAPAAHAVGAAPARYAPPGLHVTGKVDLGRLGPSFSYLLTEAPNGDVYYALGQVVYLVRGDHAPVAVLHASAPVLAVAQLSREAERRPDKRPQLSDLRDSGALEQDANTVLLLYRAERYDHNATPGLTEVIIAKARNSECTTIEL